MKKLPQIVIGVLLLLFSAGTKSQAWQPFFGGANGPVLALEKGSDTSTLWLAGNFSQTGSTQGDCIAAWRGTQWVNSMLGAPFCSEFKPVLHLHQDTLYAYANFGWDNRPMIAKKTNIGWDTIALTDAPVTTLGSFNGQLLAAGDFTTIGGQAVQRLALYDGFTWKSLGNLSIQSQESIRAMVEYQNELYVAGRFTLPNLGIYNLAKWDGNQWTGIGQIKGLNGGQINAMEVYDEQLTIAGIFDSISGKAFSNIATWDGTTWKRLGEGVSFGGIDHLAATGSRLFVTGLFDTAGVVSSNGIATWNGEQWCSVPGKFNGSIETIATYQHQLVVGGRFTGIDGLPVNHIAIYQGATADYQCNPLTSVEQNFFPIPQVEVFPNPSNGEVTVNADLREVANDALLEVFNTQGQSVYVQRLKAREEHRLQLHLFGGSYWIRVTTPKNIQHNAIQVIRW